MSEVLENPLIATAVSSAIQAGVLISGITIVAHRKGTHESLELSDLTRPLGDTAIWLSSTVEEVWSDVHVVHHKLRDANLLWIMKVGDNLRWRDEHPEINFPTIPESFSNLDPAANLYPEDIKQITDLARDMVTRSGKPIKDLYTPPEEYSTDEMLELFDTETPRYFYDDQPGLLSRLFKGKQQPPIEQAKPGSLESIVHELRDTHSPALDGRGISGILLRGVKRYRASAKMFAKERDATNNYDASTALKSFYVKHRKLGPAALVAGNIGVRLAKTAARGELNRKTAARAVVLGGLAAGGALGALVYGGNVTNAAGHSGDVHPLSRLQEGDIKGLIRDLTLPPPVKADATYTNVNNSKLLGAVTEDEAWRQWEHHMFPWLVAYSIKEGWQKVKEAPYGSYLELLVRQKLGLLPGRQFGERDNPDNFDRSKRPDMPAEAVLIIEACRVRTLEKSKSYELAA